MTQITNPAPLAGGKPGSEVKQGQTNVSTPTKWQRVLTAFLTGKSYNRFEAARQLHDHCLHSTVSTIQSKGVVIHRTEERIPGFQGIPTRCCRYWLPRSQFDAARQLLDSACVAAAPMASGIGDRLCPSIARTPASRETDDEER